MLKRNRHSVLKSYFNSAFIAPKRKTKTKQVRTSSPNLARHFANLKLDPDPKSQTYNSGLVHASMND